MNIQDAFNDIPRCVARGVALLDAKRPGWEHMVAAHIEKLELTHCHRCILGLVYGDYYAALNNFGMTSADSADHGFIRQHMPFMAWTGIDVSRYYKALADEWVRVIGERVSASKLIDANEPVLLPVAK